MSRQYIFILFLLTSNVYCSAQEGKIVWDNTVSKTWPEGFIPVEIKSTVDGNIQKAVFYKNVQPKPQPLIISLHSWSGNYMQEDPLAAEVALRGWNYIHPDFRGPNNNPEACGSNLVISDIEDAIRYAIHNGNVDEKEVHIIGASGGGYATMLAFMKIRFPVKSFGAWVGISNLEEWYYESQGRQSKYAVDIEGVTTGGAGFNAAEARKRSPIFMDFQPEVRKNSTLRIYTGIHDGYTGSVPITQSINMFNKLLAEMYPYKKGEAVSDSLKLILLEKRKNPAVTQGNLGDRKIHLQRWMPNLSLTVFEGGHEMLVPVALSLLPVGEENHLQPLNILTIGDSNGAAENGWPEQLRKLFPFSTIINKSVSGNTIGFDNLEQEKLNTLKNIDRYLEEAYNELGQEPDFDFILINLGTNDTKKVFENNQKEVAENMSILVQRVKHLVSINQSKIPEIVIISPSPMDEQKVNQEKYGGGDLRIQKNNQLFKRVAVKNQVDFLDTYISLKNEISEKTTDGVHLNQKAQFEMASIIAIYIVSK